MKIFEWMEIAYFASFTKIISGSQEYYSKLRGEICRFIAKEGKELLEWYFHALLIYLLRTRMEQDKVCGSEVKIFAASAILDTEIYVAVKCKNVDKTSNSCKNHK